MFNDEESSIFENWARVLEIMLDMKTQPTVVFYEKMEDNENVGALTQEQL